MTTTFTLLLDFDSTFIQTEGLDELAALAFQGQVDSLQKLAEFKQITVQGMEGTLPFSASLTARVALLQAHQQHLEPLVKRLKQVVSVSIARNKDFLTKHAAQIYIISSGFKEYIIPVIEEYGLLAENVYANTFCYNDTGAIIGFDPENPLSQNQGKVKLIKHLNVKGPVHVIGDGYTDYEIKQAGLADYFYAFVENVKRDHVTAKADFVIASFEEFLYQNQLPMNVSYPRSRIKILLLENVHPHAVRLLKEAGYSVETAAGSLSEAELCQKLKGVSIVGIRSKTALSETVLNATDRLAAVGAFCIGTNQIELHAATAKGACVFNAPYSNTRSVVELALGEMIMLLRNVISKSNDLHHGKWDKSATNSHEIRGKKLGIIGYGNIGSQLSVLAEALGMQVYYYDLSEKLQLGNAKKCENLAELLGLADIVTVHVDGRKENAQIIGATEFSQMKEKMIFLNLSRGHVVDLEALVAHIKSGKIIGAAVDVYPEEPNNNQEKFISALQGLPNVILTPHIGGSTEEAQFNIADFVAKRLIDFINTGDTTQSVNLPNIQLPVLKNAHRLMHLHHNVPGILAQINQVLARHNINVLGQYLKTNEQVGYVITDIDAHYEKALIHELKKIKNTIKCRVLY